MRTKAIAFLSILFLIVGIIGCQQQGGEGGVATNSATKGAVTDANHDGYTITGTTQNFPLGTKVFLQKVKGRKTETVDTSSVRADGSFAMQGKVSEKDFAKVMIGRVPAFVILGNHNITINADMQNPRGIVVGGCEEMDALQDLNSKAITGKMDKATVSSFIETTNSPFLAYNAMQFVPFEQGPEVYNKALGRLKREMPTHYLTTNLEKYIGQEKQKAKANQKTAVGTLAADIVMKNPDGKEMKLSDLKGKVVLLDFWASWCGPCRRENPHVVKAYKEYNKKGFEVFSVSLDKTADRWKQAIEKDGLLWPYHVSDLQHWKSAAAAAYGVRSIPATFLIGKDGKIVAKQLRGPRLEEKIKELLG